MFLAFHGFLKIDQIVKKGEFNRQILCLQFFGNNVMLENPKSHA